MQWPQMDPNGDGRRRRDAIASLTSDLMRELTAALAGLDTDIEEHEDSRRARSPRRENGRRENVRRLSGCR